MTAASDLAGRLGLHATRRGHRGRCPLCAASDALEVRTFHGKARLRCYYGCQSADLMRVAGGEAVQAIDSRPQVSDATRTAGALAVWNGAAPAHAMLAAYCTARGLPGLEYSAALRWRPDTRHPESDGLYAAMVALVVAVDGTEQAIHRTYLQRDGSGKADLSPAKASKGIIAGGAIRLDPAAPELVIGEGIETAAAAGRLLDLPAWAGIAAGNIERTMQLPPEVRRVVIAADPDPVGLRSADAAARRWAAEGRAVRIIEPDGPGDFADVWARQGGSP